MSRWSDRNLPVNGSQPVFVNDINPTQVSRGTDMFRWNAWGDNVDKWAPCFTLWRGSRDFRAGKISHNAGYAESVVAMAWSTTQSSSNNLDTGNGAATQIVGTDSVIQIRSPFLSTYPACMATDDTINLYTAPIPTVTNVGIVSDGSNNSTYVSRAGPDFQVFHLNRLFPRAHGSIPLASSVPPWLPL